MLTVITVQYLHNNCNISYLHVLNIGIFIFIDYRYIYILACIEYIFILIDYRYIYTCMYRIYIHICYGGGTYLPELLCCEGMGRKPEKITNAVA